MCFVGIISDCTQQHVMMNKRLVGGEGVSDLSLQAVTGFLGISKQHGCVRFVEDGVIHSSITHA